MDDADAKEPRSEAVPAELAPSEQLLEEEGDDETEEQAARAEQLSKQIMAQFGFAKAQPKKRLNEPLPSVAKKAKRGDSAASSRGSTRGRRGGGQSGGASVVAVARKGTTTTMTSPSAGAAAPSRRKKRKSAEDAAFLGVQEDEVEDDDAEPQTVMKKPQPSPTKARTQRRACADVEFVWHAS
jgi:hypothetical protein